MTQGQAKNCFYIATPQTANKVTPSAPNNQIQALDRFSLFDVTLNNLIQHQQKNLGSAAQQRERAGSRQRALSGGEQEPPGK